MDLVIDARLPLFYALKGIQIIQCQPNVKNRLAKLRSSVVFWHCFAWHGVSNYVIIISILQHILFAPITATNKLKQIALWKHTNFNSKYIIGIDRVSSCKLGKLHVDSNFSILKGK